jgi:TRAP-type C4-dicarboxylate transport system permease small subunit
VVFFGTATVARKKGHIVVGVLTQKLKGKVAKYTKIIAYICTLSFLIILFYNGTRMMILTSYQFSPALRISMSYIYFIIPLD